MTWDMEQFEMFWAFYLQIRASSPGAQLIDLIFGQDSRNTQSKHIFHWRVGATITRSDILPENSAKEIYQIKTFVNSVCYKWINFDQHRET